MLNPPEPIPTDRCSICRRERPSVAISTILAPNGEPIRYCNDNHNDLDCHTKARDLAEGPAYA